MVWGIRVKFEPRIEDVLGFRTVLHAKLRLLQRGTSGSLTSSSDKPAELVFHAAYLDRVRGATLSSKRFAKLAGSLRSDGEQKVPRFECDPAADFTYDEPPPPDEEPVRRVSLTYDELTFRRPPKGDAPAAKLRLPKDLRNRLSKTGGDAAIDEGAVFAYVMANLRWDETEVEFFGAGRGRKHAKPGTSFAHESIEDALPLDKAGLVGFDDKEKDEIYFGNWPRDFSQLLVEKV